MNVPPPAITLAHQGLTAIFVNNLQLFEMIRGTQMLHGLKIKNFRSIRDKIALDLTVSSRLNGELQQNLFSDDDNKFIPVAILYGRNASGKSNILKAFHALSFLVENSENFKHGRKIPPYEPFLFNKSNPQNNVEFEIVFSAKNKLKYRYNLVFNQEMINEEALFFYPKEAPAKLFKRVKNKISFGEYYQGDKNLLRQDLLDNQSFLSKSASSNIPYLKEAYLFFISDLTVSTFHDTEYDRTLIRSFAEMMAKDPSTRINIKKLLCAADTNIVDFSIRKNERKKFKFPDNMPKEVQEEIIERFRYDVKTSHLLFEEGKEAGNEYLELEEESLGTKKLLATGGLILSTLKKGGVLVVDELDKSLHPLLTKMLIKLFYSKTNNPNHAQLIFATHDISLLDNELFRRDQIYFTDKEYEGNTILYRLSDLKGIRKNIPYDKWYLSGRFDAIPIVNELELDFTNK